MVQQDLKGLKVVQVTLVLRGQEELQVHKVQPERLQLVGKVLRVLLHLHHQEHKVLKVQLHLVLQVDKVLKAHRVLLTKVHRVLRVPLVHKDLRVHRVLKELVVLEEVKGLRVLLVLKVSKDPLVRRELKG